MRTIPMTVGLVLTCLLCSRQTDGQEQKSVAPIYPADNAIRIDGKATDWEWAPTLGMEKYAHHIFIEGYGKAADFLARYDFTFLYVAFRVNDDSPALNGGATQRGRGPVYVNGRLHDDWIGGPEAPDRFFQPMGIAMDAAGNLAVADRGNVRVQHFDAAGKLRKSLIAEIYPSLLVDPKKPNPVFISAEIGILRPYELDWQTGVHKLTGQWAPIPFAPIGTQFVKFRGDQPYFITGGCIVYTIENGKLRISSQMGRGDIAVYADGKLETVQQPAGARWVWRDANAGGFPQRDEYAIIPPEQTKPWWSFAYPHDYHVEDDWSLVSKVSEEPQGQVLRVPRRRSRGRNGALFSCGGCSSRARTASSSSMCGRASRAPSRAGCICSRTTSASSMASGQHRSCACRTCRSRRARRPNLSGWICNAPIRPQGQAPVPAQGASARWPV